MKRTEPALLKDILEKAFTQAGESDNFLRQRAAYLWIEVVGSGEQIYHKKIRQWR